MHDQGLSGAEVGALTDRPHVVGSDRGDAEELVAHRPPDSGGVGLGLGTTDQALPFQCSISVLLVLLSGGLVAL